jgi:hypothetical protein
MELQKAGAELTSEETERFAAYRQRKSRQYKECYKRKKLPEQEIA